MINEVDKYLTKFVPNNKIPYPHLICKSAEVILLGIMAFNIYTMKVHKVLLHE